MFLSMLYLQPSVCRCLTHNSNPNINCSERTKGHVTQSVCFGSSAEARLNDPSAFGEVSRTSIWVVGCDKRWRHCWVQCLWKWWLRSPKLCSVSFPGIVFICQSEGVDQCESSHGPWSYLDAVHGQDLVLKSSSFLTAHPCFMERVTQR